MATSGSYDYSVTAANLVQSAFEDLGVLQEGDSPTSAQLAFALRRLNMLVKQYQGRADLAPGLKIHSRKRVAVFLEGGQQSYLVGPASGDARCATAYGRTTLDADEASSQTVISVTATTDSTTDPASSKTMTAADIIGIELDSGVMHWSTVASISAGDTVTIDDGLASAASSGNAVYFFTARGQRFPVIEAAVIRDASYNDTPLYIYRTVQEYELGNVSKLADGRPTCVLVEPLLTQTRITFNTQPTNLKEYVVLTVFYPAEDYDQSDGSDTLAFPQEAMAFISWELAFRCSPWAGRWTTQMEKNRNEARAMYLNLNPEVSNDYFMVGGL